MNADEKYYQAACWEMWDPGVFGAWPIQGTTSQLIFTIPFLICPLVSQLYGSAIQNSTKILWCTHLIADILNCCDVSKKKKKNVQVIKQILN